MRVLARFVLHVRGSGALANPVYATNRISKHCLAANNVKRLCATVEVKQQLKSRPIIPRGNVHIRFLATKSQGLPKVNDGPMMVQWRKLKSELLPDAVLFFQVGDFYELYHEDAMIGNKVLHLMLMNKSIDSVGFPMTAAMDYAKRLVLKGHSVAIVDQVPVVPGAKGFRDRKVTRVITPGTVTDDNMLEADANYIASMVPAADGSGSSDIAFAWLDVSTGHFDTSLIPIGSAHHELNRIAPAELLVQEGFASEMQREGSMATPLLQTMDTLTVSRKLGPEHFVLHWEDEWDNNPLYSALANKQMTNMERTALAALLNFASSMLHWDTVPLRNISTTIGETMEINLATRTSLEIKVSQRGRAADSLYAAVNRTCTPLGARLLLHRLSDPSCIVETIEARLDAVSVFVEQYDLREDIGQRLKHLRDPVRSLQRAIAQKTTVDQVACMFELRDALSVTIEMRSVLQRGLTGLHESKHGELAIACDAMFSSSVDSIYELLLTTLVESVPRDKKGYIRDGISPELDALRGSIQVVEKEREGILDEYRARSGVGKLDLVNLGARSKQQPQWVFECSNADAEKLQAVDDMLARVKTGSGAIKTKARFTLPELSEIDIQFVQKEMLAIEAEGEVAVRLRQSIADAHESLSRAFDGVAVVDVAKGFAELATQSDYCRPTVDNGTNLLIEKGRHPVVEVARAKSRAPGDAIHSGWAYTPNDCIMNESKRALFVTGANMAGKSTFLRSSALIVLLAQAGSFVPATSAQIGIVDKLFCRVGASDDLAQGKSTFFVEMEETADIANDATRRSLVIMDEIGRGTQPIDGEAIAQAVLEHFCYVRCRTLFATHFFNSDSMAQFASSHSSISCLSIEGMMEDGMLTFNHKMQAGVCKYSFAHEVAQHCGLPQRVIDRSRELAQRAHTIQSSGASAGSRSVAQSETAVDLDNDLKEILDRFCKVDITAITIEAMQELSQLQASIQDKYNAYNAQPSRKRTSGGKGNAKPKAGDN